MTEREVVTIEAQCPFCGKASSVRVYLDEYTAWRSAGPDDPRRHIQVAMPELPPGDREVLLTGAHEACFDEALG